MTAPPDGDPPREDDLGGGEEQLPELDEELRQALQQASGQPADPPADDPAPTDDTVEYESPATPENEVEEEERDASKAPEAPSVEEKPVRTVVIDSGPAAEPTVVAPIAPPAQPATVSPRPPAVPGLPGMPPPGGDPEPPPRRPRLWLRFLLASFLIVGSFAGAVASSILLEVSSIANALRPIPKVKRLLQQVNAGDAQNILVLGSDRRASEPGTKGLSDTSILLRLDPDNNAIAIMNIPRDLKTYIPGVGTTKFNEAYAYGGPKLTLRVVKRITGLPIHHVVNVDFLGFIRAINAIECVYVDVDRRYYHSNLGVPPSQQYAEIDIQPGYQKLCGRDALEFARYRHTDTDLVRAARQQDFLREARQRVPVSDLVLPGQRDDLIDIFTTYTSSDIQGLTAMLDVLDLFVASRNAPIKEIHFPAVLHPSFVTASKGAIQGAVNKFLGIEASGGPRGSLDLPADSGQTGIVPEQRKRAQARKQGKQGPKAPRTPSPINDGLVDAAQGSRDVAATAARKVGKTFPVFYPQRLPSGTIYVQNPRVYHVRDTDAKPRGAYKMIMQLPQGDYFGVQGIRGWSDPPILNDPSERRTIRGRAFDIFLDGDRVRLISWHEGDNSYWISNSLLQSLTNDQMLGMARSIGKLPGERGRKHKRRR